MHSSGDNLTFPPWSGPPHHMHNPPLIRRITTNATIHHAPDYQLHSNIPPMPIPGPSSVPTLPGRPFIPIGQRDLFFSNGPLNMSINRAASVPPPPIPPHPYLYRSPTSPSRHLPGHGTSRPPPIPPKPTHALPSRPPKIPLYPQSIPEFSQPNIPVQIQDPAGLSVPDQVSPPRLPSPRLPSPQIPSPQIPSPQIPSPETPASQLSAIQLPTLQFPTPQIPSPQILPAQIPFIQVPSPESHTAQLPTTQISPTTRTPSPQNLPNALKSSTEDGDELALALALSAAESGEQQQLRSREEEDLAKALEESRILAESESLNTFQDIQQEIYNAEAGPSTATSTLTSSSTLSLPRAASTPPTPPPKDTDSDQPLAPMITVEQVSSDEAYARALVVTEEDSEDVEPERDELEIPHDPNLPSYTEAISTANVLELPRTTSIEHLTVEDSFVREQSPEPSLFRSASLVTLRSIPESTSSSDFHATANNLMPQPGNMDINNTHLRIHPEINFPPSPRMSPVMPSTSSSNLREKFNNEKKGPSFEGGSATVNTVQYLDAHFLLGVSIGFMHPTMSSLATPMQGPIPNVIPLPYGRCPPYHFQAPSWRHLLRLLARLRATEIMPTVEAIAASRNVLQLRTVVQFVKAPDSEWRTILWLTLDHPVPPGLSALSWRYTNGDVSTLPWSYTLSDLPELLRDGAESVTSKYYTIPSTASRPYPSLPISLPNFAGYLQDALEDSRRAMHDSSSGMRRLAKAIDLCYPEVMYNDEDRSPERGVGGLFKRVIGRGNKNKKGANEDRSDMVTPFELDEW